MRDVDPSHHHIERLRCCDLPGHVMNPTLLVMCAGAHIGSSWQPWQVHEFAGSLLGGSRRGFAREPTGPSRYGLALVVVIKVDRYAVIRSEASSTLFLCGARWIVAQVLWHAWKRWSSRGGGSTPFDGRQFGIRI